MMKTEIPLLADADRKMLIFRRSEGNSPIFYSPEDQKAERYPSPILNMFLFSEVKSSWLGKDRNPEGMKGRWKSMHHRFSLHLFKDGTYELWICLQFVGEPLLVKVFFGTPYDGKNNCTDLPSLPVVLSCEPAR